MYILKKLTRLHYAVMMKKDYKLLQNYLISIWYKCWKSMQNRVARISKYKMINFDDVTNENKTENNLKWPYIQSHLYRILIIEGSGSGKTNALLRLINSQPDIDKIY